jgi:RNA polymerase sigma factor (TIGR02999 family)
MLVTWARFGLTISMAFDMLFKFLSRLMNPAPSPENSALSAKDLADVCTTGARAASPDGTGESTGEAGQEVQRLVEILYPELRRIAKAHMRRERMDHTWQPTALVSEAFMKLAADPNCRWRNRSHFLFAASKVMRLLLIDYGRKSKAERHGGRLLKVQLDDVHPAEIDRSIEYLEIHELLKQMSAVDRRMAAVVELKVFGGLSSTEIGDILGINERTVKRDWQLARAWLFGALKRGGSHDSGGVGTDQDNL